MTELVVHGIPNCDTVKKARAWLSEHGIAHRFHDFRKDGLERDLLAAWVAELGWEALVNRAGTTWRKLPEPAREGLDAAGAMALMLAHPAIIKRPVVTGAGPLIVGFKPTVWENTLQS